MTKNLVKIFFSKLQLNWSNSFFIFTINKLNLYE